MTHIYLYSAIFAQFMPAEYIRIFIHCIFKQMNIFRYSFVQYFVIRIYSDIYLWGEKIFATHWGECVFVLILHNCSVYLCSYCSTAVSISVNTAEQQYVPVFILQYCLVYQCSYCSTAVCNTAVLQCVYVFILYCVSVYLLQ